jgi:iron complex outermembrane recepter protein
MRRYPMSVRALLLAGGAMLASSGAFAQTQPAADTAATGPAPSDAQAPGATGTATPPAETNSFQEIVVTGNTSGKRTLFDSSSNVTLANSADIVRKAPRSTAETLELVPGIFVEGTAGPISNNYSVRGLRGGAQTFITLEEDGMPILYGGGGADFYFQQDITIDKLEAVEGGTSGVLAPNGAGATINFVSLKPSYTKPTASVRFTGASYGDLKAEGYFSAPITDSIAYSVGGYVQSQKGVRSTPYSFNGYNVKAMVEKRFDDGGTIRLTYKRLDQHNPYYADMPFSVSSSGKISSLPGLNLKTDDVGGSAFADFLVPDAPATGNALRRFSSKTGVHVRANTYRIDVDKPINESFSLFAHARYLDGFYDFNGIFPGSGAGTAGLASAASYLNPETSPLASLNVGDTPYFDAAAVAFPGTAQYALRDTQGGAIIPASNTAALAALGGNGLLQQTVLNHQTLSTKDLGTNFGGKWNYDGNGLSNSLTVGGMFYNVRRKNDQSAVTTVINDVRNNSHIYDVVALDAAGNVLGQLTNDGMVNYGNWGQGIFKDEVNSISGYFNDELKIGEKLHIDFGARYEQEKVRVDIGNDAAVIPSVPAGTPGLFQNVGSAFDGTYRRQKATFHDWAYTGGINYTLTDHIALYARGAHGFQTNGGDTGGTHKPTGLTLYEGGVRVQYPFVSASVIGFRTIIKNLSYQVIDPNDPTTNANALADSKTNGVQVDADIRPVRFFSLNVIGVYQDPKLSNLQFDKVIPGTYNGNTPERTPKKLLTVTPSFILPNHLGEIYGRWKYIGKIFADAGNGIALPSYSVFSVGGSFNVNEKINISASVDNLTNAKGFTEGNPRQGQTQTITNGFFYGRAIYGRNAQVSATIKL